MSQYKLTVNKVTPPYQVQLVDGDGSIPNLAGASVRFLMTPVGSDVLKVDAAGSIIDAPNGKVQYQWVLADVDTLGIYEVHWEVTYPDSTVVPYPSDTVDVIEIVTGPNLGYTLQGACSPWTTIQAVRLSCGSLAASGSPTYASDELILTEINVATDLLYILSGKQFSGECPTIVRPCSSSNCFALPYAGDPSVYDASVCGCSRLRRVDLGAWPVTNIIYVKVDGAVVDPDTYRLDGNRYLVRMAGAGPSYTNDGWPNCQKLDRPTTEPDTFEVMYEYGTAPPPALVEGATRIACELTKASTGQPCNIPGRAQSVNRQQISFTMINASMLENGLTGLWEVDLALMAYNPSRSRGQTAVWSPDMPRGGYRTG